MKLINYTMVMILFIQDNNNNFYFIVIGSFSSQQIFRNIYKFS